MNRGRWAAILAALALGAGVAGCTPAEHVHPESSVDGAATSSASSDASPVPEGPSDGVLSAEEIAEVAPSWSAGTFGGLIAAPAGYDYGGDCHESAWTVLAFTETASAGAQTFQAASSSAPRPALVLSVVELTEQDRTENLAAFTHQLTTCVGPSPTGETLQDPTPTIAGWSGLHVVSEDRDLYWAEVPDGIAVADVAPGVATLPASLADEVEAILTRQVESLAAE